MQKLEKGVYFYAPAPQDIDGDGIATSREVSQNLIGAGAGDTTVYAEAEIEFTNVTFNSGEVSNISYMFINKETKEVEFLKKIDVPEGATSAPIITMDGYVSAMFMKQSTSGMFWFSEEVDKDTVNATIECLIDNNPSYKGYNAVCFGEGEHTLEFKKNKFATYDFNAGADCEVEWEEAPETDEVIEETSKNNKNNKNKNKNK